MATGMADRTLEVGEVHICPPPLNVEFPTGPSSVMVGGFPFQGCSEPGMSGLGRLFSMRLSPVLGAPVLVRALQMNAGSAGMAKCEM